jgi:hypothetical protein
VFDKMAACQVGTMVSEVSKVLMVLVIILLAFATALACVGTDQVWELKKSAYYLLIADVENLTWLVCAGRICQLWGSTEEPFAIDAES